MSLSPGTRIGPYEVTALLGAGGMGEVYRATDTSLGREVALKVLPAEVAADAERLARFRREAQLLASLNHPNIAAIHGLEERGGTPQKFILNRRTETSEQPIVVLTGCRRSRRRAGGLRCSLPGRMD